MDPGIAAILNAAQHAVDTVLGTISATYSRGDLSCDVQLTLTQTAAWFANPDEGISTRIRQTHFLIDPTQINFGCGEGPAEPLAGDQIGFTVGDWSFVYAVRPAQSGEPCFVSADPYNCRLRVHAKLIGSRFEG